MEMDRKGAGKVQKPQNNGRDGKKKKKSGLITRYKYILEEERLATNGLFSLAESSITRTSGRKSQVIRCLIFTNERINLWNESQNQMMDFSSFFFFFKCGKRFRGYLIDRP